MRWRALYIGLLRLHPQRFRHQFADEMLWIFDETAPHGSVAPLFADALKSLCRQWLLRPAFAAQDQTPQTAAGGPAFLGLESHGLSRGALLNGTLISALTFAGVLYCATHGAGHWEGVQQIFYSLEAASWNAAEKAPPSADDSALEIPSRAMRLYASSVPDNTVGALVSRVMRLDANGDGKISKMERRGWLAAQYSDLLDHAYANRDGDITEEDLRSLILWRAQRGWDIGERPIFRTGR